MALGQLHERRHQPLQERARLEAVRAHEHRHVGGHLVVSRASRVELAAGRADDLGEPPLDRHVDVLVVLLDDEGIGLDLLAHGLEPALDLLEVRLADDPAAREHARVRERLLEVVRRQPVVERDRRVQRLEERVLRIAKAAHAERKSMARRISRVRVRKARQEDVAAVVQLLFESAPDMYERFSGNRRRALATLERAFGDLRNVASHEVVWVAELDGRIAAAMSAFPVAEAAERSNEYLKLTLRGTPFWRWPSTLRLYSAGGRASPKPRDDSLYIDALATDPELRRRGAASALLEQADAEARARSLPAVTLDTTIDNEASR